MIAIMMIKKFSSMVMKVTIGSSEQTKCHSNIYSVVQATTTLKEVSKRLVQWVKVCGSLTQAQETTLLNQILMAMITVSINS